VRYSIVSTELFPVTDFGGYTAEPRSQELTRVTGYPQGPLRKLKTDENDIFNGNRIVVCWVIIVRLTILAWISRGSRAEK
jgi:hypothetical protein